MAAASGHWLEAGSEPATIPSVKQALVILLAVGVQAQPSFEAADIHASQPGTRPWSTFFPNRVELQGMTILDLIKLAYGADDETLTGGPAWIDIGRFDIVAKPARRSPEETLKLMIRALLADRFQLTLHTTEKPLPVWVLVPGKRLRLKPAGEGEESICHPRSDQGQFVIVCQNVTMAELAGRMRPWAPRSALNHPVVDMTGLKGGYDFALRVGGEEPNFISIFDAVEKQLGLKLEERKQPMPVLAIDSVNRAPSPNPPGVSEKLPAPPTEFEAASVRPSAPGTEAAWITTPGGRLDIRGFPLKALIESAFGNIAEDRIKGAPKWADGDRFTIVAKMPPSAGANAVRAMLKSLLADRFQLVVHYEDQPVPVYALVAAKKGPKLVAASGEERSTCRITNAGDRRTYVCGNTSMARFAEWLKIGRPVVDATGIHGSYNFILTWTPGDLAEGIADPTGQLTRFEAMERQLGLRLESQKRPMPVLVIDHVAQLSADH